MSIKSVGQIMDAVNAKLHSQEVAEQAVKKAMQPELSTQEAMLIEKLFIQLQVIFPAWKNALPTELAIGEAKKTWTKGFIENGINTENQIRFGLRKARASGIPYVPSVGQFINWCKPTAEDYGLPEVQAAYRESCRNASHIQGNAEQWAKWSHDAVHVAAKETGFFDLTCRPERETFPLFKRNYEIALRRVMQGEDLSAEIPKALPKQATSIPTTAPKAKANIAAIKAMLRKAS